ncbi:hypothetical protein IM660_16560 [Ruania alkalisoli]|uniref:Uncharacterized protein n=1 Tax=Ruania alkalisoli TaxID=2779775 RepID=A0A7M1SUB0_9MICO|nr:hypothetical protein [Ruania alkalisoli]QOR70203.1 hypothetical protein IM660_16560 [Ruania alkalisoli]
MSTGVGFERTPLVNVRSPLLGPDTAPGLAATFATLESWAAEPGTASDIGTEFMQASRTYVTTARPVGAWQS